ncbi:type I methionyl aminopeptidase [Anaeromyxobacter paludicola]|uniref:Methionine aminopeptidase n=1 Tax=Anaeromyxobacter paludicola TaxID=2918171 RepID=A0ABN6N2S7_9BACT|nr:type I methionyl aminopeptidase [Anaeromyxobacter paludicola]BDG07519.1 methionine aminopeptidase [Anaeromyxobacter paludicola]
MSRDRIELRTADEVARIRDACLIVHDVLEAVSGVVAPGVTTGELDALAADLTERRGARPAFKGYHGYPAVICISINDEVVHGIPSPGRRLAAGDVVGLDFGVVYKGWFGDSAVTVPVGGISTAARRLLDATRAALGAGIEAATAGGRVGDIGAAVQGLVEARGYSVVRDFVGHGIGRRLHELPQVPNFGAARSGPRLRPGMILAIEPMVNAGGPDVRVLGDGWTAVTVDGSLSAHFEHTVAITEDGPEILTRPS